jgi:hypothetical protein
MSEEWGPWVDHDGSGVPAPVGTIAHRVFTDGREWVAPIGAVRCTPRGGYSGPLYISSWDWSAPGSHRPILRYRLRRPPAVQLLVDIAETLPVRELEDA